MVVCCGRGVGVHELAAETGQAPRDRLAHRTEAHEPDLCAGQSQAVQLGTPAPEAARANHLVSFAYPTGGGEQQRHGEFRGGFGEQVLGESDGDAALSCGGDVDVIGMKTRRPSAALARARNSSGVSVSAVC